MNLDIGLTTPSVLFTVISLLFVGYNNRLHCLAMLIREMDGKINSSNKESFLSQMLVSKKRILLIKKIQLFGIISFIFSLFSILFLAFGFLNIGSFIFIMAILSMIITLSFAVYEIVISTTAIEIEIERHLDTVEFDDSRINKLKNKEERKLA